MEMYGQNYSIEFFSIKHVCDLNFMYSKVLALKELYRITRDYF